MNNLNKVLLFGFLILCCKVTAQKGTLLVVNASQIDVNKNEILSIEDDKYYNLGVELHRVTQSSFYYGLNVWKSFDKRVDSYSFSFLSGVIINRNSRLQFPLTASVGYSSYNQMNIGKFSGLTYGINSGIRFYITDDIAFQAKYLYRWIAITTIDGVKQKESVGTIGEKGLCMSISYYF